MPRPLAERATCARTRTWVGLETNKKNKMHEGVKQDRKGMLKYIVCSIGVRGTTKLLSFDGRARRAVEKRYHHIVGVRCCLHCSFPLVVQRWSSLVLMASDTAKFRPVRARCAGTTLAIFHDRVACAIVCTVHIFVVHIVRQASRRGRLLLVIYCSRNWTRVRDQTNGFQCLEDGLCISSPW